MAYTYEDFTRKAQGEGLLEQFSQQDLATVQKNPEFGLALLSVKRDLANATTGEQRLLAAEAENQLRRTYNAAPVSTGNSGKFVYSREDDYKKLFDSLTNPDGFAYDFTKDPVWSAYKKEQLREADRSMKDTLAAASSATGGVPSSYAVSAAQQARDYEASKIGAIIPELYEAAYGRQLDALELLEKDKDNAYADYLAQQQAAAAARAPLLPGSESEPADLIRNDALQKLLDAGRTQRMAVGNPVNTDNWYSSLRSSSRSWNTDGQEAPAQQGQNFAQIRSAAFDALTAGRGMDKIVPILEEAMKSGEISYAQYVDILQQMNALMEE